MNLEKVKEGLAEEVSLGKMCRTVWNRALNSANVVPLEETEIGVRFCVFTMFGYTPTYFWWTRARNIKRPAGEEIPRQ